MSLIKKTTVSIFSLSLAVPLLFGCVGGKSQSDSAKSVAPQNQEAQKKSQDEKFELVSIEEMKVDEKLKTKYDNIVIGELTSSQKIRTDYPNASNNCSNQIVNQLKNKNTFKQVLTGETKDIQGTTAIVDLEIKDMRIASGTARMWGGVFAGNSFMDVEVKVRQSGNNEILHQKLLTTSNNAWAASYSGGSTDKNLPADFGVLIGEYLSMVIPTE